MIGLSRRRMMMGGKVLPYDAEIEYLRSSGTQFINLPLSVSSGTSLEVSGHFIPLYPSSSKNYVFSATPYAQFEGAFYSMSNGSMTYSSTVGNSGTDGGWGGSAYVKTEFKISTAGKIGADGVYAELSRPLTANITGFRLFGSYRNNNRYAIAFCDFKIIVGGLTVYDMIPVRKNGVGYMYDKVSGQFFGNDGTGDFILGKDKNVNVDWSQQYLTFEAVDSGTFKNTLFDMDYSLDGGTTWTTLTANTASPTLAIGERIMWRATVTPDTTDGVGRFSGTAKHEVMGNPMSLLLGDNFRNVTDLTGYDYAFKNMFYGDTNLVVAKNLSLCATTLSSNCYRAMFYNTRFVEPVRVPAATLTAYCYYSMFQNNTWLKTAPELSSTSLATYCYGSMFQACVSIKTPPSLPAATLAANCYQSMFNGCTSLTTPPTLSSTSLAASCYYSMFSGCTNLEYAPVLPATSLETNCYRSMFNNCKKITTPPSLSATTLRNQCYYGMFSGCTALTTAPALPSTTAANDCYRAMFSGCTSLTVAPALPATALAVNCYYEMFRGCTSLVNAPSLPAITMAQNCYVGMFYGCTSLTTAPDLPALRLGNSSYNNMFNGCTSLVYVKALFVTLGSNWAGNWLSGVSASGTFVKNVGAPWAENDIIPSGWTVQTQSYTSEIEYLEADSSQYIATSYVPVVGDTIHIEFLIKRALTNSSQALYSAGTGTYQSFHLLVKNNVVNGAYFLYFASGTSINHNFTPSTDTWYTLDVTSAGVATINNISATSSPIDELDGTANTIWLFKRRNGQSQFYGRIRRFYVTNGNTKKIDLIPVRMGEEGAFYDTVNNVMYVNAVNGFFIKGNDVTNNI